MKRRVLAMVLSMAMVFTMLPATTLQAEENVTAESVERADAEWGENLARSATASAAHNNTQPAAINDGALANGNPATSWNCWNAPESSYPMPVTLTWSAPQKVASMRVMWWSDGGGVTWPSNAKVQYLDGSEWKDIANAGTEHGGFNGDSGIWNVVNFKNPVTTTALRMLVGRNVQGTTGVGISEWEVYGNIIKEKLTQAQITGASKVVVGEKEKYVAGTVPSLLASSASYEWSVVPADVAVIEGNASGSVVSVKGLKEGQATLKLKATHEGVSQETEMAIRVRLEKIQSIHTYRTATAAGVAPILPDSVVANGLEFDEPTPSLKSTTKPDFDFAEEFNSRLIPVTWETVDAAKYAKGQEGKAFTVKGTATYDNKDYVATALVTVKEAAAAAESNSSVTFENVQLNDVFWAPKQEINAKNSLKKAITEIEKASGGEPNYDNAIKKLNGETDYDAFNGYVFQDSDIYKSIEAISYTLSATQNDNDPEMAETRKFLEDKLDSWIQKIEKVQYADGYIDTFFTLRSQSSSGGGSPGTHRWLNLSNHEMYNAGHFLEGVVAYTRYREGIGKPDYRLYVAGKRFADHIVETFGPAGKRHEVPGHEEIELALVKFGKLAEEYEGKGAGQDYYDTVKILIDRRGEDRTLRESGYKAGTYSQDATPFKEETTAVGHAVRANYFYTGITDIATLLPDGNADRDAYLNSLDTICDSVTEKKTYITGAIGTTTPGSDSEGYGKEYDLPPGQSYAEICAAIAAANWNQRMNLLHEDAKYADMVERNLYNSILVGTNLDGNRFYYSTLLEVNNGQKRSEWFGCACCPPNLMRTIAAASGYMYTVHNNDLFVNMYIGSNGKVNVGGTQVTLKQETKYPWEGTVKITVSPAAEKAFTMKIRIPGWVNEQKNKTVTIKVNNTPVSAVAEKGYVAINRTWKAGDVVDIDMPMEVRKTESHPLVEATQGEVALQRGPVVYCMEKAGNAQLNANISNFDPLNFVIPRDAELTATYNKDLLNGVVEITGDVKYQNGSSLVDAKLQAIPYYAWNNRGDDAEFTAGEASPKNSSSKMLIWTTASAATTGGDITSPDDGKPEVPVVPIPQLRKYATPSVNHVGWGMGAENFADDDMASFWNGHNDANLATTDQWMMYDFGQQKVKINGSTIDFYDNTTTGDAGVMRPDGLTIQYEDANGEWKEVAKSGEYEFVEIEPQRKTFRVEAAFTEVETSKIKVTLHNGTLNGERKAVAVSDWKLSGDLAATEESKAELTNKVSEIETAVSGLKEEDYVADSWAALQKALSDAKAAAENENTGMIAGAEAQKALVEAFAKLDKKADASVTKSLETLITKYESEQATYAAASWTEFAKVLAEAKKVLDEGAGTAAINEAKKNLTEAAQSLDKKAEASAVNDLKAAVAGYTEAQYTAASWAKFRDAYTKADTVAKSTDPGQKEVEEAASALRAAESKLDKKATAASVSALKSQVASFEEGDYTAESWKRFAYTLKEVEAIANGTDPGQKVIDAAKISLETAKDKLEMKASAASVTKLNEEIEKVKASCNQADFTKESWADFLLLLDNIKKSAEGSAASQTAIDALIAGIDDTKAALEKKASAAVVQEFKSTLDTYKQKYKEEDYTEASWAELGKVLKRAEEVANDPGENTIKKIPAMLEEAAKKVVTMASYNKVADAVAEANSLKQEHYTADSWAAFNEAVAAAKKAMNDKNITQAQMDALPAALAEAKGKLVEVPASEQAIKDLGASVTEAQGKYNQTKYTVDSWKKYADALEAAKKVTENKDATQKQVDDAMEALEAAIKGLKEQTPSQSSVDKRSLNASITKAKAKKQIDYTSASWKKLKAALTAAQNVAKNAKATQSQVNTAKKNLDNAVNGLVKLKASSTKKLTLGVGETYSVKTKNCTYLSSNTKIATVSSKGLVKAKKTGSAVVKAIPKTGNKAKVFKITVKKAPKKITKVTFNKKAVKKNKATLKKGKKGTFKVTLPKGTASQIKYTSSKKKVATISSKGVVKAKKKGKTVITIKTFNKKTKKITLTVK